VFFKTDRFDIDALLDSDPIRLANSGKDDLIDVFVVVQEIFIVVVMRARDVDGSSEQFRHVLGDLDLFYLVLVRQELGQPAHVPEHGFDMLCGRRAGFADGGVILRGRRFLCMDFRNNALSFEAAVDVVTILR
jgi:hypothetical protein